MGISFIIPYYQLSKNLLLRAVDSIVDAGLTQDYEIIVVDDGTPNSEAGQWLEGYERVRYAWQENGGLSAARNTGISLARMDYLQFLDADDYFFPGALRQLEQLLQEHHPEVLQFGYKHAYSQTRESVRQKELAIKRYDSGAEMMAKQSFFAGAWSYVVSRKAIGNLRFMPGIYHEDEDFTPQLFAQSGVTIMTNITAYAYYQRQGSIINDADPAKTDKRFRDMLGIIERFDEWIAASESIRRQAFIRRKDQFALSIIYEALRRHPDFSTIVSEIIPHLANRGCWPLPKARYTRRYSLFRVLTDKRWKLRIMRKILYSK